MDTDAPADTGTPPPATDTVSRAEFERLQNENKTYRERFQPFERAMGSLDPADRQNFLGFIQSYAAGDMDTASQWLINSARSVAGDRFEELVRGGATQAQAANIVQAEREVGHQLDPDQVAALVDERVRDALAAQDRQRILNDAVARLGKLGVEPDSHHAAAILHLATSAHRGDIEAAYASYVASANELSASENARRALALSRLGNGSPSPDGAAVPSVDPTRLQSARGRREVFAEQMRALRNGPR
jgi:hypothetical protein